MDEDFKVHDAIQSMLALTHAIQNRLIQSACRNKMSEGVAMEVAHHCKSISEHARRISCKSE